MNSTYSSKVNLKESEPSFLNDLLIHRRRFLFIDREFYSTTENLIQRRRIFEYYVTGLKSLTTVLSKDE